MSVPVRSRRIGMQEHYATVVRCYDAYTVAKRAFSNAQPKSRFCSCSLRVNRAHFDHLQAECLRARSAFEEVLLNANRLQPEVQFEVREYGIAIRAKTENERAIHSVIE